MVSSKAPADKDSQQLLACTDSVLQGESTVVSNTDNVSLQLCDIRDESASS